MTAGRPCPRRPLRSDGPRRKERSQSPANVPTDVNMGGFGALLGGDKKKKDKDKKKKKKSRSKDSLTDLDEVTSIPFDEDKYRGKCKAAVAEYFSIEVVDEVVACARKEVGCTWGAVST